MPSVVRVKATKQEYEAWAAKARATGKWTDIPGKKEPAIVHGPSGARFAWYNGYAYIVAQEDLTAANFGRTLSKVFNNPVDATAALPEELTALHETTGPVDAQAAQRERDAATRANADLAKTPAMVQQEARDRVDQSPAEKRRAAKAEEPVSMAQSIEAELMPPRPDPQPSVPDVRGEAEPGDVVRGELVPGDVVPEETEEEREAARAVEAVGTGTLAAELERELDPVFKKVEEQTAAIEAEEAEERSRRAAEQVAAEQAREALKAQGIDVNDDANITKGWVLDVSIVSKIRIYRTVERAGQDKTVRQRLPDRELAWVDQQRSAIKNIVAAEGGTEILPGIRVVPDEKVPVVMKRLNEAFAKFEEDFHTRIVERRDEINQELQESHEAECKKKGIACEPLGPEDLLPPDLDGMFVMKKVVMRMEVPSVADMTRLKVERDEARKAYGDVTALTRETMERSLLKRFADAYDKLGRALDAMEDAKEKAAKSGKASPGLNPRTRSSIQATLDQIDKADTARSPVVRAEMEKFRAYLAFVLKVSDGDDATAGQEAAATVKRVVAISNAAAPLTGGKAVAVPDVKSMGDAANQMVEAMERDMEGNARRYGVAVEPEKADKENIKQVKRDGSVRAIAKGLKAVADQYTRLSGK